MHTQTMNNEQNNTFHNSVSFMKSEKKKRVRWLGKGRDCMKKKGRIH